MEDEQIEYLYFGDRLGGRPEGGLEAFLASEAFGRNVTSLLESVKGKNAALMCAEREQEKCHRQYVVAEIERRGIEVTPIGQAPPGSATLDDFSNR